MTKGDKIRLSILCKSLSIKLPNFNPYAFITRCGKAKVNPKAIIRAFTKLNDLHKNIINPWAFCVEMVKINSQNINEEQAIERHLKIKSETMSISHLFRMLQNQLENAPQTHQNQF